MLGEPSLPDETLGNDLALFVCHLLHLLFLPFYRDDPSAGEYTR